MLAEVPVITVAYSGLADFCIDETALLVRHRVEPARTHLSVDGSSWAEPDHDDLARHMRTMYDGPHDRAITDRVVAARRSSRVSTRGTPSPRAGPISSRSSGQSRAASTSPW